MNPPVYLNTEQVARRLAFDGKHARQCVRQWLSRWNVPTVKRGRRVLVLEVSIVEALKRQTRMA